MLDNSEESKKYDRLYMMLEKIVKIIKNYSFSRITQEVYTSVISAKFEAQKAKKNIFNLSPPSGTK